MVSRFCRLSTLMLVFIALQVAVAEDEVAPARKAEPLARPIPMPIERERDPDAPPPDPGRLVMHDPVTGETTWIDVPELFPRTPGSVDGSGGHASGDGLRSFNNLVLVQDPSIFPASANCRLIAHFTGPSGEDLQAWGSGTLIDARTVLTAGHCIYQHVYETADGEEIPIYDWADWIEIIPATTDGSSPFGSTNSGFEVGLDYISTDAFIVNENLEYDIAAIRLDRGIGFLAQWYGYKWDYSCGWMESHYFGTYSFPGEDCTGNQTDGLFNGLDMYYRSGTLDGCDDPEDPDDNEVWYDISSGCYTWFWGGQSGSSLYSIHDDGNRYIHAVAGHRDNTLLLETADYVRLYGEFATFVRDEFIPLCRGDTFDLEVLTCIADSSEYRANEPIDGGVFFVANPTNDAAGGVWDFGVYLSTNSTILISDSLVASNDFSFMFEPVSGTWASMGEVIIPIGVPSGDYWIGAILDPDVDENTENNGPRNGSDPFKITVTGVCDLAALLVEPMQPIVSTGTNMSIETLVWNQGGIDSDDWDIDIVASTDQVIDGGDPVLFSLANPGLDNGDTFDEILEFQIDAAFPTGVYYIGMVLDAGDGDEISSNNSVLSEATVEIITYPLNDDPCDAVAIDPGLIPFSSLWAATDGSSHPGSCQGDGQIYNDVWYRIPSRSYPYSLRVTTCEDHGGSADFNTNIAVYKGHCGSLNLVGCNDDDSLNACGYFPAFQSTVDVEIGQYDNDIFIRVGGSADGDQGTGELLVEAMPVNDDCNDAIPIGSGETSFSTVNATTDGQPHPECDESGDGGVTVNDIWYTHTASFDGKLVVSTCDAADYDTDLVAYQGTCGDLELIDCNDDGENCTYLSSHLEFFVNAGEDYLIRVGGWGEDEQGTGTLTIENWELDADINNDGFVDVLDLLAVLDAWGGSWGPADVTFDGVVDILDLLYVLASWSG